MVIGMNIKGSPTSIELFGLQDAVGDSQDLFDDLPDIPVTTQQQFTTPSKKRPCFRSPHLSSGRKNDLISPLSAAISNSVQGIYCSQEIKDQDSNLQGEVWNTLRTLKDKTDILLPYSIKNILHGNCLYRGKVAHISAIIKSVEAVSHKDTSFILHDNTGEIKAAVHSKVMEKYGALLEPGVGLLLRQCTIFSFISVQKYVNITLPNVVHIYNTSSLHPDQGIIDKHIVEVSEINVQKEQNPDMENQTPNITLNTPNRPPPPRPSRNNISRTTSPQNNSRNTPQNNFRTNTPQNETNPHNSGNRAGTPANQTPQKTWTPQRTRFQQQNQTPQKSAGGTNLQTPPRHPVYNAGAGGVGLTTPVQGSRKRTSGEAVGCSNSGEVVGGSKKTKTTPPPAKNGAAGSSNISPKEQEEIARLLEDIDDSFFDDF